MKKLILILAVAMVAVHAAEAGARNKNNNNLRAGKVIKGKPAVEFVGTIKSIVTNTLPKQLIVNGSSNSSLKDAPHGMVAFEISSLSRIKNGDMSAGSFNDLKPGKKIGISYSRGVGDTYKAHSIDLNPPDAKDSGDEESKPKNKK